MSYANDQQQYDLSTHGIPREMTACPGCGRQYGHHKTKVCKNCEECSACHADNPCDKPEFQSASVMIALILEEG
jgi:hypothetical protein